MSILLKLFFLPALYLLSKIMVLPGTEINDVESPPGHGAPTDVGTGFMVGLADRGPTDAPWIIRSFGEFTAKFGARQIYSILADTVETFFKEGGVQLYIKRVVGAGAARASLNLVDNAAAVVGTIRAANAGAWANNVSVQVQTNADDATIPAGSFKIVLRENGSIVEESITLADKAALVAYAATSEWITFDSGLSANDPVRLAATNLAGGADDRPTVTDAVYVAAINSLSKDYGPGQVAVPGVTSNAVQAALLAHCDGVFRTAVLDGADTPDDAALRASATALRNQPGDRYAGMFAPWDQIPPLMTGAPPRAVPPCGRVMGNMARNDGLGMSPNDPAAGPNGKARYVIGVTQTYTDAQRSSLNDAGVNVSIVKYGGVRTYGFRTLADPVIYPARKFLSNARLRSAIKAQLDALAEAFQFSKLDGQRRVETKFGGQITGALTPWWTDGSLYGETANEAFSVNTGPQVNTIDTVAAGERPVEVAQKMSPFNERTIINVAKLPVTEAVS
jgi:hypothetical protein